MKNSKYFEKISENFENFDFISTNTNEIATFIISLQHSYKNDSKFSNELIQKIMNFGDVKNSKTPIFAINLYEKDFSCLIISFLNEDKGAIIITNSEKGKDFSLEILRSIDSVYNWNTFTPKKITCSPQDKIHKN